MLPIANTGESRDTIERRGASSGQMTPMTPIGSGNARTMCPTGAWCTTALEFVAPSRVDEKTTDTCLHFGAAVTARTI